MRDALPLFLAVFLGILAGGAVLEAIYGEHHATPYAIVGPVPQAP